MYNISNTIIIIIIIIIIINKKSQIFGLFPLPPCHLLSTKHVWQVLCSNQKTLHALTVVFMVAQYNIQKCNTSIILNSDNTTCNLSFTLSSILPQKHLASITFKPENTTGPYSWHKNQQMASIILHLEIITCIIFPLTYTFLCFPHKTFTNKSVPNNQAKITLLAISNTNFPHIFFLLFVIANPTQVFPSLFMKLKKKHLGRAPYYYYNTLYISVLEP